MCRSDSPLPRGKKYRAEIKIHGDDKGRRGKREEKGWARRGRCAQIEEVREGEQGGDEAGGGKVGRVR